MVKHRNLFYLSDAGIFAGDKPINIIIKGIDYSDTMFIIAAKCLMKQ